MLKHKTAYPITTASARTLSNISGFPLKDVEANIGWVATYDETKRRRWGIVPESFAIITLEMDIDRESYQ